MVIYGEGRRKRYSEECLEILQIIIDHMKQGKTAQSVEEFLATKYARTTEINEGTKVEEKALPPHSTHISNNAIANSNTELNNSQMLMHIIEQQNTAIQSIAKSLETIATQKNNMQRLEDAARTSKEENILLRQEVKILKSLLESSDQIHHDDLDQMRKWMNHFTQHYNKTR